MKIGMVIGLIGVLCVQASMDVVGAEKMQSEAVNVRMVKPGVKEGARIFVQRCADCHGYDAMGDGLIPLSVGDYPSTNLMEARFGKTEQAIRKSILEGGGGGGMSPLSPPWADELNWHAVESLVLFIRYLHSNTAGALKLLKKQTEELPVSKKLGQIVFSTRCVICHGEFGDGKGKLSAVIKSPPPFNLRKSRLSEKHLRKIIREGGEAVGRSKNMPPWKAELTAPQIDSVILYIKTFRDIN